MRKKNSPGSFKQEAEFLRVMELALNKTNPSNDQMELLIKDPRPIYDLFGELFVKEFNDNENNREVKIVWQKIYKEWFGIEKDFSNLKVPANYDSEKHFAVIVAQGLTMNEVITEMQKRFKVWSYTENLGASVTKNDRTAENGDYIVLFNKNIEIKKGFKDSSANEPKEEGHQGITLMERLLLEVLYFDETKKHLDINNVTLCSGSRDSAGNVIWVYWGSDYDGLNIIWYWPTYSGEFLRSRVVASF